MMPSTTMTPLFFARLSVLSYLAVVPFPHNAAGKNLTGLAMLLAALWLARKRLLVLVPTRITLAFLFLLVILGISASLGVSPSESFNELRKHFFPSVLLLLIVPVAFSAPRWQVALLATVVAAFAARLGLALSELAYYLPDLAAARSEGRYVKGLALDAGFYLPAMIGLMILGKRGKWLAAITTIATIATIILVQGRAPLLAAIATVSVMLTVMGRWRSLFFALIASVLAGSILMAQYPNLQIAFQKAFEPRTYLHAFDVSNYGKGNDGFSGRVPIWQGVWEIAQERPALGYGFGWKKLGNLAMSKGYVDRWQAQSEDPIAKAKVVYFSLPSDKVNPHNLYLQFLFEAGWFGLVAYLILLWVLLHTAVRFSWRKRGTHALLAVVVLGFLVDHVILGMANGLMLGLGPSMAYMGLLDVLQRKGGNEASPHPS